MNVQNPSLEGVYDATWYESHESGERDQVWAVLVQRLQHGPLSFYRVTRKDLDGNAVLLGSLDDAGVGTACDAEHYLGRDFAALACVHDGLKIGAAA